MTKPRFFVGRRRPGGRLEFRFEVKAKDRPPNWPATIPLDPDRSRAITRAAELNAQLDAARLAMAADGLLAPVTGTLPWLRDRYFASPEWGRLHPRTQREYRRYLDMLMAWSAAGGHRHVRGLGAKTIREYLRGMDRTPVQRDRLAVVLGNLLNVAVAEEVIERNPLREMRALPKARAEEAHIWTEAEFRAIVDEAERQGRTSVVLVLTFMRDCAQRLGDALRMEWDWFGADGWCRLKQSKRGARVACETTPELRALLARAREAAVVHPRFVALFEHTGQPYDMDPARPNDQFTGAFERVRKAAGLPHLKAMHLRHTGVVEMARAGCTVPEIASRTGHATGTVDEMLKRYMPPDETVARNAGAKLSAWRNRK